MLDTNTPQPVKDLVYCCQAYLFWLDEYDSEHEWSALNNVTQFRDRIRQLVPTCIELLHDDSIVYRPTND